MNNSIWKTTAIIFFILLVLETSYFVWAVKYTLEEEKNLKMCYYEVCKDNEEAVYQSNVCYCYDYDYEAMDYELVNTRVIG